MSGERVVIVEDRGDFLEEQCWVFKKQGLVLIPILSGQVTAREIMTSIQGLEPPADMVLVEVRKADDDNWCDGSNRDLVKELKEQDRKVVIYSINPDCQETADCLGVPFIWKIEGPQKTAERIKELLGTSK